MKKSKFEFYRIDILGLIIFYIVYKLGAIVFLLLLASINGLINNPDLIDSLTSYAPLIGLILGVWAFYKLHNYYKKRKQLAEEKGIN